MTAVRRGFFAGSRVRSTPPARVIPQCGACGLFRHCRTAKMPVGGDGDRRVLFVGERPGVEEDTAGKHFVGKPGQYLRRVLRRHGFELDKDGWQTNAIICHPKRGRRPTPAEVDNCIPNISKAIELLEPDVIVPLGPAAVRAVVGPVWGNGESYDIGKWAGWRIPCQALNAWVCPTWHPADLLHADDAVLYRQFDDHLAQAVSLSGKPWSTGAPQWDRDVGLVFDPDRAAKWLHKAALCTTGAVAWDYETNMLKPDGDDAKIVSCSVAWGRREPERCIAFPWQGAAIPAMQVLIRSPVPKIASNLKFEDRWTRKYFGHRVRAWAWDTMLAAHVCDNRRDITSVKFQAFVRLGAPLWSDKIEPFLKTKADETANAILRQIHIKDLLIYNGLDSLLEFRVAVDQIAELGYPMPWQV